jgi:hypothetical protein
MMKDIILSFLAICFLLLIITYVFNMNQIKLWNYPIIEGNIDINSAIASQTSSTSDIMSPLLLDSIDATLETYDGASGTAPTNIIQNLINLKIQDTTISAILADTQKFDIDKIKELKTYIKTKLKPKYASNGLVLHYVFDNIENNTVPNIAPSTIGKYDAKVNGTCKIDKYNYKYGKGSMKFNHTNHYHDGRDHVTDYLELPSDVPIPSFYKDESFEGFTFAVWYKATTNSRGWARLFEFAKGPYANHTILASCNFHTNMNYTFIIAGPDSFEWNLATTTKEMPPDTWVHVATTISSKGIYTNYINGVKSESNYQKVNGTTSNLNSIVFETNPETNMLRVPPKADRTMNRIGKSVWYPPDSGFDGWMNDFRIYNKTLTDADITAIYNLQVKPVKYSFLQNNLAIQVDSKSQNIFLNPDNTIKSIKAGNNATAYLRGPPVEYCSRKQVISIPPRQYLEIPNNSNFGNNQFTVAIVINVNNFNPTSYHRANYVLGSNGCSHFEMYIQNNSLYVNPSCRGGRVIHNFTNSGNSINIFIIKVDTSNTIHCSVNGNPPTSINAGKYWTFNNIIRIGSTIDGYYSSETLELYEFIVLNEFCDIEKQQEIESYLANKWALDILPATHPSNSN